MNPLYLPLYCNGCGYKLAILSTEKFPCCPHCGEKQWRPAGPAREATEEEVSTTVGSWVFGTVSE